MQPLLKKLLKSLLLTAASLGILAGSWWLGAWLAGVRAECLVSNTARLALVLVTMVGFFLPPLVLSRMPNIYSKGDGSDQRRDLIVPVCTLLGLLIGVGSPMTDAAGFAPLPGGDALRWTGVALYTLGFVLMIWAPAHLGKQFSIHVTLQEGHELVTTGPYALMRHPRYTGCILWAAGAPLAFLSLPGLLLALPYCVLLAWRTYNEEAMLSGHFKEAWRAYSARTKRLVPFLY